MKCFSRRTALRGAAVIGVCAAASACGGGGDGSEGKPGSVSGVGIGNVGGEPAAAVGRLGSADEVPVGGGRIYKAQKVVVTQPTAGEFMAFSAVCTHQGCIVSSVKGETIVCACHGSSFSIVDGAVLDGPAPAPLKERAVIESGGNLELT